MSAGERIQTDQVLTIGKRYSSLKDPLQGPRQIDTSTAALRDHQSAIPDSFWSELLAAIQALPAESQPLFERYTASTSMDIISDQRELVRLLAERIRTCPTPKLLTTIASGLRVTRLVQNQAMIQQLVSVSCLAILTSAIGSRRADIQNSTQVDSICHALDACADDLWESRLSTWRREAAVVFTNYHSLNDGDSSIVGAPHLNWWEKPIESGKKLLRTLVWRLNRERPLLATSELESMVRLAKDNVDLIAKGHAVALPTPIFPEVTNWIENNPFPLNPVHKLVNGALVKAMLQLAVLRADLCNQPLPLEPFTIPPAPLRPIERDGVTIGWYSIGPNGVDDGGVNGKYFGMPITQSLGSPKFAGPPKPRP